MVLLSTFRRGIPYRAQMLALFICSNSVMMILMNDIPHPLKETAPIPDASLVGYSPQQVIDWLINIGPEGRQAYLKLAVIDNFVILSYMFMLSSHLLSRKCPDILCYLPSIAALFDVIETGIHSAAAFRYPALSSPLLFIIASASTQFKYLTLAVSIVLGAIYSIATVKKLPKQRHQ